MKPWLAPYSPLVKLLFLLVLSITVLSVFLFFGGLLVEALWGFNIFDNPEVLSEYSIPFVIDANRLILLFQHLGLFILPGLIFLRVSTGYPNAYIIRKGSISLNVLGLTLVLLIAFMPIINFLVAWNESIQFPGFLASLEESFQTMELAAQELTQAILTIETPVEWVVMIFLVAVLPAFGEELIFRGIVQKLFSIQFKNYHLGIWATAFLFSAMHLQFYGFIPRMILGAIFGYLMVYSGSIIYPMLAHFLNNFLSLIVVHYVSRGNLDPEFETFGASLQWEYILPGAILFGYAMFLLYRKRQAAFIQDYIYDPDEDMEYLEN
jgi:membrane protease YdiL (CAAX protease family)